MKLPADYVERVYAGVLGKIIGVYLGRPFEGWQYDHILSELGEINYYVHEKRGVPLVVTDDDISGTFTFLRALSDYGNHRSLTPKQIGQSWLNYIIENRTILWWGGLGNSTEHTAFLRLKSGLPAPQSGSIATNGKIVAEQIGAQIFIDGWGMIAPGDPELAAEFARKAGSVSHDGEAIYGAQVVAAMEAQAFIEKDINKLLDTGTALIPKDSVIYRLIAELREVHTKFPDWHEGRNFVVKNYGYDKYVGNCHMVPNHALIILALLYGEDSFQKSLMIVNTSGWDTDCNSGNVGCIMGIKNGLAGINEGPDWRGPVADRLFVAAADGGRVISDAVIETYHIVNSGRALAKKEPLHPKDGARFHFELPGSVQGFRAINGTVENATGHCQQGKSCLALHSQGNARFSTPTFIPPDAINMPGYALMASPTLYPGQKVRARLVSEKSLKVIFSLGYYNANDNVDILYGPEYTLPAGKSCELEWIIPDLQGLPIEEIGFESPEAGSIYLDYLTWDGMPHTIFTRPAGSVLPWPGPKIWRKAWVDGVDQWEYRWREPFRIIQNEGRGLISTGTREWTDYQVQSEITPVLIKNGGIAARVQGMKRFYALLLSSDGKLRLIKALDGDHLLAEVDYAWDVFTPYVLKLQIEGNHLTGWVNDKKLVEIIDDHQPLLGGGIALVVEEGHLMAQTVEVKPTE
jgi:ADP-ribosylglycohydrolase